MACLSPATASGKHRAGATASATEEAKVEWWLRFNNGVPAADDGDAADSGDEVEEEAAAGAGGKGVSCGRAERSVAADEEVGMGSCSRRVAMGAKAGMVARGGGKAEAAAAGSGCNRQRSSPRFADRAELDGGNHLQPGELPRRKKKAIAKRSKPNAGGVEVQNDTSQAQSPQAHEPVDDENENLRLQLALKTNELRQEENRRIKLELVLKEKEIESLQKKNKELKAENEQLRKNVKPPRVERLCRYCNQHVFHDYRNCPKRRQDASSPEEEDGEASLY